MIIFKSKQLTFFGLSYKNKYPPNHLLDNNFMSIDLIASKKNFPDIMATVPLEQISIEDFKIIEGRRKYKLVWQQQQGTMFKWTDLSDLKNFEETVYNYEIRNLDKIRTIEQQWAQYYIEGIVHKPYIYFDLEKAKSYYEEPQECSDSSFELKTRKKRRRSKQKAMDFQILPDVNFKKKKKRIRKQTKKDLNSHLNNKNKKNSLELNQKLEIQQISISNCSFQSLGEQKSSSWSRIIEPFIRQCTNQQKEQKEEVEQNNEPHLPEKEQFIQDNNDINQKRQQIIRACHEAMENAQKRKFADQLKENQKEQSQSKQHSELENNLSLKDQKSLSNVERDDQNSHFNIYSSESNVIPLVEQAVIESEPSQLNNLHRSNIRSFLMQEMKKLNIDTSFIENAKKNEDINSNKVAVQRIMNSPLQVKKKQKIKQIKNYHREERIEVNLESVLIAIQKNTEQFFTVKDFKFKNCNEQYICSRILPYVSLVNKKYPKILNINGQFKFKNFSLYSVQVGNLYECQQMFTIRQVLLLLCPDQLERFHNNSQNDIVS